MATYGPDGSNQAGLGLLGTSNSPDYRRAEIERHFHSYESWFGVAAVPSGETHVADRVGPDINPFQIDAGDDTWGSWVQILGSSDTPARDTNPKFDLHRIDIVAIETGGVEHVIQIGFGESADLITNGEYTEFVFTPVASTPANPSPGPIDFQCRRQDAGCKVWARVFVDATNTSTVDFFVGLHEYEG